MRTKVDWNSGSTVNYKDFCKKHPHITISSKDWRKVIYSYNYWFRDYILETGEKLRLPMGLGDVSICKKRVNNPTSVDKDGKPHINLPVDWKKTKEIGNGKRIFTFNYHTEGFSFRWQWFKTTARFTLARYWSFKATRDSSRKLAYYLKNDDKYQHIYQEWRSVNKLPLP